MFSELQEQLGLEFQDLELYKRCFTHKSYLNEASCDKAQHNERLEFLGDAVLELVTTDYLFRKYPDHSEGDLTAWRAALVKGKNLAQVSRNLNLGTYLELSKGEEQSGGRNKDYLLANVTEALIGAIYLDLGFDAAKKTIHDFILVGLEELIASGAHEDPKSELQEYAQEKLRVTPHYELVSEEGPDHDKVFTMAAVIDGQQVAHGKGSSKQKAERSAAEAALAKLLVIAEENDQLIPQE